MIIIKLTLLYPNWRMNTQVAPYHLKGIGWCKKKNYYSPERKTCLTKNNKHVFPSKVCFNTFSEKRKENELHGRYMLLGGPAENRGSSYNFTNITKLMILFHLQWLGRSRASHTSFANFWKIKIWEANQFFPQICIFCPFFVCVACFYWKEIKYSKSGMWLSRQFNFLQNDVCFSLLGQKLWEEIHF